jgi:hypothetical protein
MIWQFSINHTIIDEPAKWDGMTATLERNMNHHGIFRTINIGALEFIGTGYAELKTLYDTFGSNANATLKIEYQCDEFADFVTYYEGVFDFNTFQFNCDDYCFCRCEVIANGCVDAFISNIDKEVNLDSVFDINLVNIGGVVQDDILIEGQTLFLQNKATNESQTQVQNLLTPATGARVFYFPILLPKQGLSEFGDFNLNGFLPTSIFNNLGTDPIFPMTRPNYFNYGQFLTIWERTRDPLNCIDNDAAVGYTINGTFKFTPSFNVTSFLPTLKLWKYNFNDETATVIYADDIGTVRSVTAATTDSTTFSITRAVNTIAYQEATALFFAIEMVFLKTTGGIGTNDPFTVEIEYSGGNIFQMQLDSDCDSTNALSIRLDRVLEWLPKYYTGANCPTMQVSEELCFDNYHLTNGLRIRQAFEPNYPFMFTSFEDLFKGTKGIFNYGWGYNNKDTELRCEPLEYFYQNSNILNIGSVKNIRFEHARDLTPGTVEIGYSKWEAEEYNGLDEMNTKRQYRVKDSRNNSTLSLLSDIITAGTTIEITRRKNQFKTGTSDWRYDNDLFLINTEEFFLNTFKAVRGVSSGAANIYVPATRMNYRLTPVRNMLRWVKSLAAMLPTVADFRLRFNSSDGNYLAEGRMTGQCDIENAVVNESQTVQVSQSTQQTPLWAAVYLNFEAPLSMEDWELLSTNYYGRITLECNGIEYRGNVISVEHRPNEGLAKFKLLWRR